MENAEVGERIKEVLAELPEGVKLVAVSKYHPEEAIMEAYKQGQRIFGENHEQELKRKLIKTTINEERGS